MQGDSDDSRIFTKDPSEYGPGDAERAFEQYRMYVADIGRLERLRGSTNTFYLSANTGLAAALAALAGFAASGDFNGPWLIAGCAAGLALGYWWRSVLLSYATLARAKWSVATRVEETLPLRLYLTEWSRLKGGPKDASYVELNEVERRIPLVFMIVYSLLAAYATYILVHGSCMQLAGGA